MATDLGKVMKNLILAMHYEKSLQQVFRSIIPNKTSHNYGCIKNPCCLTSDQRGNLVLWYTGNWSIAKSFDSGQPAQTAQPDLSRYFFADAFGSHCTNHGILSY